MNPERINIKDLTIEEPEKVAELPFDVERDITPEDFKVLWENLEETRIKGQWFGFSQLAMQLKVLEPNLDLNLDEDAWKGMMNTLEEKRRGGDSPATLFTAMATAMKVLDPSIDLRINQSMTDHLKRDADIFPVEMKFSTAIEWKIMGLKPDLSLNKASWSIIKENLDTQRSSGGWSAFANLSAKMKMLDPSINLHLDETAWEGMKTFLVHYRSNTHEHRWINFSELAANMKILAAEKVEITDNGLEITMPGKKTTEDETPSVPEIRNF